MHTKGLEYVLLLLHDYLLSSYVLHDYVQCDLVTFLS